MPIIRSLAKLGAGSAVLAGFGWKLYTRESVMVPVAPIIASQDPLYRVRNPHQNPLICHDAVERKVPLSKLRTRDQGELTRAFCAGVWSGPGFWYQRRYLAKKYRHLEGRDEHLWGVQELADNDYPVGTKIADHFEVVERDPSKVVVRCGDSPHLTELRPSDGLFSMEVDISPEQDTATFRLTSKFFNSTPEGAKGGSMPAHIEFLHREYAKLWMETSVRRLLLK